MSRPFVPAAGHDLFLPLYDPFWKLLRADRIIAEFVGAAGLAPRQRVLDVGCGTGSLAVRIARELPGVELTGIDPDPKALERARRKAAHAGVRVHWEQGYADDLPYAAGAFDRVLSSFMFHHLDPPTKRGMLSEVRRVLRPEGELHLLDFAPRSGRNPGVLERLLHGHQHVHDQRDDRLQSALEAAGFTEARQVASHRRWLGHMAHVRGRGSLA